MAENEKVIINQQDSVSLGRLVSAFDKGSYRARKQAMSALEAVYKKDKRTISILTLALLDKRLQDKAAEILRGDFGLSASTALYLRYQKYLEDNDQKNADNIRVSLNAYLLTPQHTEQIFPLRDVYFWQHSAILLGEINQNTENKEIIQQFLGVAQEYLENSYLQRNFARMIGKIGGNFAFEYLQQLFTKRDSHVRQAVADALGDISHPKASEALINGLSDNDPWVCIHILDALEKLNSTEAMGRIYELIHVASDSHLLRRATITFLKILQASLPTLQEKYKQYKQFIMKVAKSEDQKLYSRAMKILADLWLRDPDIQKLFVEMIRDKTLKVSMRGPAFSYLSKLSEPPIGITEKEYRDLVFEAMDPNNRYLCKCTMKAAKLWIYEPDIQKVFVEIATGSFDLTTRGEALAHLAEISRPPFGIDEKNFKALALKAAKSNNKTFSDAGMKILARLWLDEPDVQKVLLEYAQSDLKHIRSTALGYLSLFAGIPEGITEEDYKSLILEAMNSEHEQLSDAGMKVAVRLWPEDTDVQLILWQKAKDEKLPSKVRGTALSHLSSLSEVPECIPKEEYKLLAKRAAKSYDSHISFISAGMKILVELWPNENNTRGVLTENAQNKNLHPSIRGRALSYLSQLLNILPSTNEEDFRILSIESAQSTIPDISKSGMKALVDLCLHDVNNIFLIKNAQQILLRNVQNKNLDPSIRSAALSHLYRLLDIFRLSDIPKELILEAVKSKISGLSVSGMKMLARLWPEDIETQAVFLRNGRDEKLHLDIRGVALAHLSRLPMIPSDISEDEYKALALKAAESNNEEFSKGGMKVLATFWHRDSDVQAILLRNTRRNNSNIAFCATWRLGEIGENLFLSSNFSELIQFYRKVYAALLKLPKRRDDIISEFTRWVTALPYEDYIQILQEQCRYVESTLIELSRCLQDDELKIGEAAEESYKQLDILMKRYGRLRKLDLQWVSLKSLSKFLFKRINHERDRYKINLQLPSSESLTNFSVHKMLFCDKSLVFDAIFRMIGSLRNFRDTNKHKIEIAFSEQGDWFSLEIRGPLTPIFEDEHNFDFIKELIISNNGKLERNQPGDRNLNILLPILPHESYSESEFVRQVKENILAYTNEEGRDWKEALQTFGCLQKISDSNFLALIVFHFSLLRRAKSLRKISESLEGLFHDCKRETRLLEGLTDIHHKYESVKKLIKEVKNIERFLRSYERLNLELTNLSDFLYSVIYPYLKFEDFCEITYNISNLPDVEIDKSKLESVIKNIIVNAYQSIERKFGAAAPQKGLISIEAHYEEDDRPKVWISISDNGEGIPEDLRKKLFRTIPSPSLRRNKEGRGLGLFSAGEVLDRHRGGISPRNAQDVEGNIMGAIFELWLPVA